MESARMSSIDDFIIINEADRGPAFADPVFARKYKLSVPDFPHHIVAWYQPVLNRLTMKVCWSTGPVKWPRGDVSR